MGSNVERHMELCKALNDVYVRKNHDYGDSFHQSFMEEGMAMPRIRLVDKMNRFKVLSKNPDAGQVQGESLIDTLMDMANYALMTVMEMEADAGGSFE